MCTTQSKSLLEKNGTTLETCIASENNVNAHPLNFFTKVEIWDTEEEATEKVKRSLIFCAARNGVHVEKQCMRGWESETLCDVGVEIKLQTMTFKMVCFVFLSNVCSQRYIKNDAPTFGTPCI